MGLTFAGLGIDLAEEIFDIVWVLDIPDDPLKSPMPIFYVSLRKQVYFSQMPGNMPPLDDSTLAVFIETYFSAMTVAIPLALHLLKQLFFPKRNKFLPSFNPLKDDTLPIK